MEDKFREILNEVTRKSGSSCREPDAELIDELRRREHTYRDIARILVEKCQFSIPKSTLNDFVLVRSRGKVISTTRTPSEDRVAAPIAPKAANADSAQKPSEEEIQQRIAAVKARNPVTSLSLDDFHFDLTQPLRLITREKPGSD